VTAANGKPGFITCRPRKMTFEMDAPEFDLIVANITREGGSLIGGTETIYSHQLRSKWAGHTVNVQRERARYGSLSMSKLMNH
jgi:hypothetical protein